MKPLCETLRSLRLCVGKISAPLRREELIAELQRTPRNAENINMTLEQHETTLRNSACSATLRWKDLNAQAQRTLRYAEEAILQGPGTVYLDWKTSMIGGKGGPVRAYVIYRREQSQGGAFGSWKQVGVALETHTLLTHQPRYARPPARARNMARTAQQQGILRNNPLLSPRFPQEFTRQDAEDLLHFVTAICEYVFVLTERFNEFMKRTKGAPDEPDPT